MNRAEFQWPDPVDKLPELADAPSIFLSASIPYVRDPAGFAEADRQELLRINERYASQPRPERIRAAVSALARVALSRNVRLVFGAHPSISPMVLQVAQDLNAEPASILVFQSEAYRDIIPEPTLKFANWSRGMLILTRKQPEDIHPPAGHPVAKRLQAYPNSLKFMRRLMMQVPGMRGAVFIGGMDGVEIEADMFSDWHKGLPLYALQSTGSAAERLAGRIGAPFKGTDMQTFQTTSSYTVAASMILDQLQDAGGTGLQRS